MPARKTSRTKRSRQQQATAQLSAEGAAVLFFVLFLFALSQAMDSNGKK